MIEDPAIWVTIAQQFGPTAIYTILIGAVAYSLTTALKKLKNSVESGMKNLGDKMEHLEGKINEHGNTLAENGQFRRETERRLTALENKVFQ